MNDFQFSLITMGWNELKAGALITLNITFVSFLISLAIGIVVGVARSRPGKLRYFFAPYVEFFRGTPLLIQLFFIYFVIAPVFNIPATPSAILALSLFEGAYTSEILRGAIFSISKGQWEAAYSLGFSSGDLYCRIILPQALRTSLPALANQAINTVKDSALVSTIAIYDLTMRGREIISETFLTFEIWFTVAAIYLLITLGLQLCIHLIDRSLNSRR
jgi:polar amino acid transport system permease protein